MVELKHTSQRGKGKVLEHLLYSYDPVGNRIRTERIEDNDDEDKKDDDHKEHRDPVITNYAYDALNQLTQVLTMNSSDHESLIMTEYNYDAVGNRLTKRISWGDLEDLEEYTYDLADRLIHVQNGPSYRDYSYDPRGNLLKVFGLEYDFDQEMSVTQSVYNITNLLMLNQEPDSVVQQVYSLSLLSSGGNQKPRVLEEYVWGSDNRLIQMINPKGDISRFAYDGDGNRIKMTVDVKRGPDKGRDEDKDTGNGNNGNGNGNGKGKGKGHSKCDHVVPPGFVPPGLAKKCGPNDEFPEEHPGGPRDGWEKQHQKKHWEFHYTNDVSYALPQVLQVTEDDPTKWKELYTYGPGAERISMTYLPAYDHDNGWEPYPGAGGAEPGVVPKTLYYITDILGSNLGLMEPDGRMSARYHYDEFGMVLDSKKFDVNWPGPDNLIGYTGLEYDYYTDLNYARARYYKPEIGRFISEDSYKGVLGNPLSQNRYTYVENNPINYVDPSGHWAWVIQGGKWVLRTKTAKRVGEAIGNVVKGIDLSMPSHFGPIVQPGAVDVRIDQKYQPTIEPHKEVLGKDRLEEYFNKQGGIEKIPLNQPGIDIESFNLTDDEIAFIQHFLNQYVFPENPSDFNPEGLVRKDYKNGEIIKWIDPKTGKAVYEWNKDAKNGDHYHLTPDGKNRMEHPDTGDTHYQPGDRVPEMPE